MIRGVKALKAAAKPQTTFLCLSSSNTVYIRTILEVLSLFTQFKILTSCTKGKRAPGPLHRDSDQPCRVGSHRPAQTWATRRSQRTTAQLSDRLQPKHLQRWTSGSPTFNTHVLLRHTHYRSRTRCVPQTSQFEL